MGFDQQKLIRTSRLSLTCIFLFLLTWYYQVPESSWSLVTLWFVMYEYNTIGGVYTKSLLRIMGTIASALYGLIIIYFCDNNPLVNIIALVPGLFTYAYFFMGGDKTYVGTIGAVTLTIVLLNYNDVETAIIRGMNVMIGIAGSMFMIRFFYPQYARDMVLETLSTLIERLLNRIIAYLDPSISLATIKADYFQYEHQTLENFLLFSRMLGEAKIETAKAPLFISHAKAAMEQFKVLFRLCTVFISHLSTDAVRTDPWVREKLREMVSDLRSIERRLLKQPDEKTEVINEQSVEIQNPKIKLETAAMITNMQQSIALLEAEVKQVALIHNVYHITTRAIPHDD